MLGENHQIATKALVDHYALPITFRHPAINTTIQCEKGNTLHAFPSLVPPTTSANSASSLSATATPITCLLTGMATPAQPKHRIELHRGLNLITVCITLTAALLGSTLFNSSLFHVISGPTSLSNAKSMLSPPPPYYMPNTKCHPSRPIPNSDSEPVLRPSPPHTHLFPSAQYSEANSLKELPITDPSNVLLTPFF